MEVAGIPVLMKKEDILNFLKNIKNVEVNEKDNFVTVKMHTEDIAFLFVQGRDYFYVHLKDGLRINSILVRVTDNFTAPLTQVIGNGFNAILYAVFDVIYSNGKDVILEIRIL